MVKSVKILVANGVNLDLLGQREQEIYGSFTLKDLQNFLLKESAKFAKLFGMQKVELEFFQTNVEAEFLEKLSFSKCNGFLINPGAWTHTSIALGDRLAGLKLKFVEVHISNISAREEFRNKSFSAPYAGGVVYGLGIDSYAVGLYGLIKII